MPEDPREPDVGGRAGRPRRPAWYTRHLWQIQPVRDVLLLLAVFGLVYLGYVLRTVTVPLLLALLLAYLLEPVVQRLERSKHFTRQGAVSGILAAVVVFIAVPATLATAFAVMQGVDIAATTKTQIDRFATVTGYVRQHDGAIVPHLDSDRREAGARPRFSLQFYERVETENDAGEDAIDAASDESTEGESAGGESAEKEGVDPPAVDEVLVDTSDLLMADDERVPAAVPLPRGDRVVSDAANAASAAFDGLPSVLQPAVYQYLRKLSHNLDDGETSNGSIGQLLDWALGILRGNAARMTDAAVEGGRITIATGLATVTSIGMLLFGLFLTGFFFFFLSTGYARVRDFAHEVLPHEHKDRILDLLGQMDRVVAGFVRGRITIAIIQSVIFTILYWLIGVPAPLIFGPLVGILSIVPYVALLGIPMTIVALAIDNSGWFAFQGSWWWTLGAPVAVYFAGQAVDDYVLTPAIQGKATNMDTPTILFASLAGGILGGIYGLLLAIPVAACVKILLRELFWPRFHAWLEGEEKDFLPLKR